MGPDLPWDVHLLPAGPLVVAVSGGADSMALWALLADRDDLVVFHLDHGLRPESAADAAWVAHQPLPGRRVIERTDIATQARAWRCGLEEAGRRVRYERLAATAATHGAAAVVTAHHRDDQAETVLMNLLRGARGAIGMPAVRPLAPGVSLVRPLLGLGRDDLRAFLRNRGLDWREDASNRDPRFTRNRVRLSILPQLEAAAPGLAEALAAAAAQPAADSEGRALIRTLGARATRGTVRRLDGLAEGERTTLGGFLIHRRDGRLIAEREHPESLPAVSVTGPGRWRRGDHSLTISEGVCSDPRQGLWLSGLAWPLAWRCPEPGERWIPLGLRGSQTVARTLAAREVGERARRATGVLADAQGAVCIPSLGLVAERCRVTPGSRAWALALAANPDTATR